MSAISIAISVNIRQFYIFVKILVYVDCEVEGSNNNHMV